MNFPNQITGTFNKPITLGVGTLRVYKDDALFLTFTEADIIVTGISFTIEVTNMFPDYGDYFILIDSGLFYFGIEIYKGITDITKWTFSINPPLAYYNSTYYNNTNYNTD